MLLVLDDGAPGDGLAHQKSPVASGYNSSTSLDVDLSWCFNLSDCPWDLDGNGIIGFTDLGLVLNAWGPNPGHPADFDGNGVVGFTDLGEVLNRWGLCP